MNVMFLERLALLVDEQRTWRENQAMARRLKAAKLRGPACVEDIDYRAARGLDMKTSAAKSGRSAKIVTRLVPPCSLPSCQSRAGTSKSEIPPPLTAYSTVSCTTLIASRCAESPCVRNVIRRRRRRRNEPKSTSLSARWGFLDSDPAFAKGRFIFEGRLAR